MAPHVRRAALRHAIERLEPRIVLSAGELDPTFGSGGISDFDTGLGFAMRDVAIDSTGRIVVLFSDTETGDSAIGRFLANGSSDPAFNLITGSGLGALEQLDAIAVQSDDKIIVAGNSATGDVVVTRLNLNGSIDGTFGVGSVVISNGDVFTVNDLAIRADDRIVVAGGVIGTLHPSGDFALVGLTSDGDPDGAFGTVGNPIVTADFIGSSNNNDAIGSIALMADGRIAATGKTLDNFTAEVTLGVALFNADGTPHLPFNGTGKFRTTLISPNAESHLVISGGDRMVFLDTAFGAGNNQLAVVQLDSSGFLDTEFSTDGIASGFVSDVIGSAFNGGIAIDPLGQIVIAYDIDGGGVIDTAKLVRLNLDGTLDTSFNDIGVLSSTSFVEGRSRLLVGPSNTLLLATATTFDDLFLARLQANHPPTPAIDSFTAVTGTTELVLRVRYDAEVPIDPASVATTNVRLRGPGNFSPFASAVSSQGAGANGLLVTYRFTPPGGTADVSDNGNYDVEFQTSTVTDVNGNAATSPPLGVTLNVNAGLADLSFSTTSFNPGLYFPSDTISAALTASVVGTPPTGFDLRVVLSPDSIAGNTSDVVLLDTVVTTAAFSVTSIGPIPTDIAPGKYYLIVRLDPDGEVAEFDEANNQLISKSPSITIRPAEQGRPSKGIGKPDSSFGDNGQIRPNLGFSNTAGILEQPDGSILITGALGGGADRDVGIARRTPDGNSDPTFGGGDGFIGDTMRGTDEQVVDIALLPDGKIIVAGTAADTGTDGTDFFVTKRNADGSRDTSFGDNGRVFVNFDSNPEQGPPSKDIAKAMLIDSQGRIVIVGRTDAGASINFALARITADGQLDGTFGVNGRMITDFAGEFDAAETAAFTATGAIVVAGTSKQGSARNVALAQYTPDGMPDTTFGNDGIVIATAGGTDERASSLSITPTGQIVVAGFSASGTVGVDYNSRVLVARFSSRGVADKKFDRDGVATLDVGIPARATYVEVLADGRIIASGIGSATLSQGTPGDFDIVITRFTSAGLADTSFDGDGFVILSTAETSVSAASATGFVPLNVNVPFATTEEILENFQESAEGKLIDREGGGILIAGTSGAQTVVIALITSGIELSGEVISAVPASVIGGVKGSISINVANLGDILAEGLIDVDYYASADQELGSGDREFYGIADRAVKLKPLSLRGKVKKITAKFIYPSDLPDGTYYLLAVVTSGSIAELSTDNNTAFTSTPIIIAAPVTDLTGPDLGGGVAFASGKTALVPVMLVNEGNVPVAATALLTFVFSLDELLDGDDFTTAAGAIKVSLKGSASKVFKVKVASPPITPGDYFVFIVLDSTNAVAEANEANNLLSSSLTSLVQ